MVKQIFLNETWKFVHGYKDHKPEISRSLFKYIYKKFLMNKFVFIKGIFAFISIFSILFFSLFKWVMSCPNTTKLNGAISDIMGCSA